MKKPKGTLSTRAHAKREVAWKLSYLRPIKGVGTPFHCYSIQPNDVDDSSWLEVHLNQGVTVREKQGFVHGKTQVINEFFVTNNCYIVDLATNRLHLALKLVWALCHGLASVKLIQHYLRTFPSCASIDPWLHDSGHQLDATHKIERRTLTSAHSWIVTFWTHFHMLEQPRLVNLYTWEPHVLQWLVKMHTMLALVFLAKLVTFLLRVTNGPRRYENPGPPHLGVGCLRKTIPSLFHYLILEVSIKGSAMIQVAVVPIGTVSSNLLRDYYFMLLPLHTIPLSAISSFYTEHQKSPFAVQPWDFGSLLFKFVVDGEPPSPWEDFQSHRKTLAGEGADTRVMEATKALTVRAKMVIVVIYQLCDSGTIMPKKKGRGQPKGSQTKNCQESAHGNLNSCINPSNMVEVDPGCEEPEDEEAFEEAFLEHKDCSTESKVTKFLIEANFDV
ncbi:hypothetical protein JHK86_053000 [Glycine max]|nr:hypothetical protein JHK86_053000 [Glycine max]